MKTMIIVMVLALVACATGTVPFDPSRKQKVEPQLSHKNTIRDGMSCYEYCRVSGMCDLRTRIAARQTRYTGGCHVYMHPNSIDYIRTIMQRRGRGGRPE